MALEIDFGHGEHGVLLRSDDKDICSPPIVIAYLPQGARIGINEAHIIEAEYDAVRTSSNAAPLTADRVKTVLDCRCS